MSKLRITHLPTPTSLVETSLMAHSRPAPPPMQALSQEMLDVATQHGFYTPASLDSTPDKSVSDIEIMLAKLALISTEITEAINAGIALRRLIANDTDWTLPNNGRDELASEFADIAIRTLSLMRALEPSQQAAGYTATIDSALLEYYNKPHTCNGWLDLYGSVSRAAEHARKQRSNELFWELAHIVSSVERMAWDHRIDIWAAIQTKHAANKLRPYRHGKAASV